MEPESSTRLPGARLAPQVIADLAALGRQVEFPAGAELFGPGTPCLNFPVVRRGQVAVVHHGAPGQEIQLYRLSVDEPCILSLAAMLGNSPYGATATTMVKSSILIVPVNVLRLELSRNEPLQMGLYYNFANRLNEVMALVSAVTFEPLAKRVLASLLRHASDDDDIAMTHQGLAQELGSAREVVSRLLSGFAADGLISMRRGHIRLLDRMKIFALVGERSH